MLDPMLKAMFEATVMPVIKQMPTDQLSELRAYLDENIGHELAGRNAVDYKNADLKDLASGS